MVSLLATSGQSHASAERARRRRRIVWRLPLFLGAAALVGWGLTVRRVEMDLTSARKAESFDVLGIIVSRRVDDTAVSRLLLRTSGEYLPPANWRTVAERSPWHPVSPHFTHHGSLAAIEEIDRIARLTNAPDEEVLQISRRALEHLRQDEIGPANSVINQWWISRRHLAK